MLDSVPRFAILSLLLITLGACGGGGGGGGNKGGGGGSARLSVSFTPSSIVDELLEQQKTTQWSITATLSGTSVIDGNVFVIIEDQSGLISTDVSIDQVGTFTYRVILNSNESAPAGTYQDAIRIRICRTANCSSEYPGSPFFLPVNVEIASHTNLTALDKVANYSGWSGFQSGETRNAYIDLDLDPTEFSPRWINRAPGYPDDHPNGRFVVTSDKVFYLEERATAQILEFDSYVVALDEFDGSAVWDVLIDTDLRPSDLAFADDIIVSNRQSSGQTYYWGRDAETGASIFDFWVSSNFRRTLSPVFENGVFYSRGLFDNLPRLVAHDSLTATEVWNRDIPDFQAGTNWTPTVRGDDVVIYDTGLRLLNKSTGLETAYIQDSYVAMGNPATYFMIYSSPVLVDSEKVAIFTANSTPKITVFDTASSQELWSTQDQVASNRVLEYVTTPVSDGVLLFALLEKSLDLQLQLQAFNVTTGALEWTLDLDIPSNDFNPVFSNMALTNSHLFISLSDETIAIDLNSRAVVWSYPYGGSLAISDNAVLLVRHDRGISAINLREVP